MASWNSYAPLSWQSPYLLPTDESEQPYFTGENRTDGLARHRPASSQNAAPVSLIGNLADLPVTQPFENFRSRSIYPFLDLPGTAPWFNPGLESLLAGRNSGLAISHAVDRFNDAGANPTQVQWLPPLVRPFTGGGAEFFARPPVKPPVPELPHGMTRGSFGDLMRWGDGMQAKDWVGRLKNEPELAPQIIRDLKNAGFTKEMARQWRDFYGRSWQRNKDANDAGNPIGKSPPEQFWHRSDGLQHLYDQWPAETPSTSPALPLYLNPYGPWCTDPTQCT